MLHVVLEKRRLAATLLVLLSGCGGDPPSTNQDAQSQAGSTHAAQAQGESAAAEAPTAEASVALSPQEQSRQLAEKAEQALRDERMFAPAGSNAFEWFLQAHELDRDNVFARDALFDLIPYAVLHIEQRLAARDRIEAAQLLPLLQRAQPDAPALPRLQRALAALPTDAATANTGSAARPVPISPSNLPREVPASTPIAVQSPPPAPSRPPAQASAEAAVAEAKPEPLAQAVVESTNATSEAQGQKPEAMPITRNVPGPTIVVPEPLSRAAPRYPVLAERRKIEGSVELEFTIQTDGSVANVRVLRSQPEGIFDRDAIAAMQRWRYPPLPAAIKARRSFDFKLGKS